MKVLKSKQKLGRVNRLNDHKGTFYHSPSAGLELLACVFAKSLQSCATLWTVAHQAPLPCPPPGNLPDPGIEFMSLMSPALAGGFFTTSTTWEALIPSAKVKEIKAKINKWDQIQLINVVQQNNNLLTGRKCLQMI